jgi:hypothetical protein
MGSFMLLQVESRVGLYGDPEPLAFLLGSHRVEVVQIVDRWIASDHSYFKVDGSDGGRYILRFNGPDETWELTLFQAEPT